MTTLAALINLAEQALADESNTYWSADEVGDWLNDAIRDYSIHFPRNREAAPITTIANDRKYDLAADFLDMLSVEYPTGEDPPCYLKRRPYTHPNFWNEDGYYDIIRLNQDDANDAEIWISEKPPAGESITYLYHASHDYDLDTGNTVTVPGIHHHILIAYVLWQATKELQLKEQANPTSNSSLLMAQLGENAERLRRAYESALDRAKKGKRGQSAVIVWEADELNTIY